HHLLPRRSRDIRLRDPRRLQFGLASRLPQRHPRLRRLPGTRGPDPRRGRARLRPRQYLALCDAPHRRGDVRRAGPARLRPRARPNGAPPQHAGQLIGKSRGVAFNPADMVTEIAAADSLTLAAAWRLDQGLDANRQCSEAKLYASEMLARVTDEALQIHGGM